MDYYSGTKGDLPALLARIEDLRILLDLEARCLSGHRLNVARTITLQSLREFYPGSSRRFRDELLMSETDDEALLMFALEREDQHEFCNEPRQMLAADHSVCGGTDRDHPLSGDGDPTL